MKKIWPRTEIESKKKEKRKLRTEEKQIELLLIPKHTAAHKTKKRKKKPMNDVNSYFLFKEINEKKAKNIQAKLFFCRES